MKKNNAWNIRRLVHESFVPVTQWPSVLYWRLSDLKTSFCNVQATEDAVTSLTPYHVILSNYGLFHLFYPNLQFIDQFCSVIVTLFESSFGFAYTSLCESDLCTNLLNWNAIELKPSGIAIILIHLLRCLSTTRPENENYGDVCFL